MTDNITAIVPAAGVGRRMQADRPKQYLPLAGKTLLQCTLENLISHPSIVHIVVALHPEDPFFPSLDIASANWLTTVAGGQERADSVLAALQKVTDCDWVMVHDAARPCVLHDDIDRLLALCETGEDGGILAYPVRDTMKRAQQANGSRVSHTEPRQGLWHALTPQLFRRQYLLQALTQALASGVEVTDEASAIEWYGGSVKLVESSASNIKVTRPEDLALAEFYLTQQRTV
ncbi:2-C-methyl-D-erythritol 4-phosphate cytidylyltransferase [Aestuariibacter salexigens]|uniref:2-C-methyl-D-erythritol 4-phosphate cytidylyltransferase n=1 Tax=Aestuariibacter salexigens TaxID=226010 RepID=UPI000418E88F|nr:2-C-methyl-D-erythritol 4-phosphate cytidylyltransferase [Aestuariibacter salexigens]